MLTLDERDAVLRLARHALEARVRGLAAPPGPVDRSFAVPYGVFVTLLCGGELRGCLGRLDLDTELPVAVIELAAAVSDSDPRFDAVCEAELDTLEIEVSLLTTPREVVALDEIDIGRHGLIVESGSKRGLLLPQVASDNGWDAAMLVAQTCLKAGLHRNAWPHGARLFAFEAVVFGDGG